MDGNRFDDLTRSLTRQRSRRRLLRALGLAAGAGAVATVSLGCTLDCRSTGSVCRKPGECCSNTCVVDATRRGRCA